MAWWVTLNEGGDRMLGMTTREKAYLSMLNIIMKEKQHHRQPAFTS